MIRRQVQQLLLERLRTYPAVALIGPRQCGKTTLARQFARSFTGPVHYFDLEDYTDLAEFDHPKLT